MMNKMKLEEKRMNEVLGMALSSSPLGILRRLKELDREGEYGLGLERSDS